MRLFLCWERDRPGRSAVRLARQSSGGRFRRRDADGCGRDARAPFCNEMQEGVAGFLSIDNVPDFPAGLNFAGVAHLPAHFGIERGSVECDGDFVFDVDSVENGGGGGKLVKSDEIGWDGTYRDWKRR